MDIDDILNNVVHSRYRKDIKQRIMTPLSVYKSKTEEIPIFGYSTPIYWFRQRGRAYPSDKQFQLYVAEKFLEVIDSNLGSYSTVPMIYRGWRSYPGDARRMIIADFAKHPYHYSHGHKINASKVIVVDDIFAEEEVKGVLIEAGLKEVKK